MRKIPETFKRNKFECTLLKRKGDIALYELRKKSEESGKVEVFGYEIHKVRKKAVVSRTRKHFKEILAGDEEFGEFAWSYQKLENAEKCYQRCLNENNKQ